MAKVMFVAPGNLSMTRLGLVEVEPGAILSPAAHMSLVADRLQEMIDQEELTLEDLDQFIADGLETEGREAPLTDLESAGWDLLSAVASKLQADGTLISQRTKAPLKDDPDLRTEYQEMTVQEWINRASMMPL